MVRRGDAGWTVKEEIFGCKGTLLGSWLCEKHAGVLVTLLELEVRGGATPRGV